MDMNDHDANMHTHTHSHTCTYVHTHTHSYMQTCTHTHTHTRTHILTHAHMHTHSHTHTHSFASTKDELHEFAPDKEPLSSMLDGEIQAMYMCKPGEHSDGKEWFLLSLIHGGRKVIEG